MGIVRGNSDLLSRYNLATNGSFKINQRGNFQSWSSAKLGDFVSDAWEVNYTTIDHLEALNIDSQLAFRGYGKKGQVLNVLSKDNSIPMSSYGVVSYIPITASIAAHISNTSIPISFAVQPRYRNTSYSDTYYTDYIHLNRFKTYAVGSRCISSAFSSGASITGMLFGVLLDADGEFEIRFNSARELPGVFVNPPEFAPVHYAEDFARCKRYYQKGNINQNNVPIYGEDSNGFIPVYFPVEMAGTPSVSVAKSGMHQRAIAPATGHVFNDEVNWTVGTSSTDSKKTCISMTRSSAASYGLLDVSLQWTATV